MTSGSAKFAQFGLVGEVCQPRGRHLRAGKVEGVQVTQPGEVRISASVMYRIAEVEFGWSCVSFARCFAPDAVVRIPRKS